MALKITEQTSLAQRKFMEQADKLLRGMRAEWQLEEFHESCNNEYQKLFGRVGIRPLQNIKGGKPDPRYLVDRDETWVLYKPPLWEMGGNPDAWLPRIEKIIKNSGKKAEAIRKLADEKKSLLQEYHGLVCGYTWAKGQDEDDEQNRAVRDWGFLQRLDVETDGPVLVAKTWRAQRFLQVQLKEHIFNKAYMCLVHGKVDNRIQYVSQKFAALGGGGATQIMVKYTPVTDPFFHKHKNQGWWKEREVRNADTFFKPLAYYRKKGDGSDYTLVYVNILSGITHQVRVTMQSVGHPLVSDDRYLPKEVAMSDADWCPRNFLVEVRSDWFDMCGPYQDRKRRAYTRISMENPLPKLFQDILETKLQLVEKLDATADLNIGCRYWALGDELLMLDFQKDSEYRKKVMRWGIRRGIGLDALDRLLLLSREDIDKTLAEYKPPSEDEDIWVCPLCMSLNQKGHMHDGFRCKGALGKSCNGTLKMPEDTKLPNGWRDYIADPTLHMLKKVNPLWLEARKKAIQVRRPQWQTTPAEDNDGDKATDEQIQKIHEALVEDAKNGGFGIHQKDLIQKVKGLEGAKMPLKVKEDSEVRRVRLPGSGIGSAWIYTLAGKERFRVASTFSCQPKRLTKPIAVETEVLPQKNIGVPEKREEADADMPAVPPSDEQPTADDRKRKRGSQSWDWDSQEGQQRSAASRRTAQAFAPQDPQAKRYRQWRRIDRMDGSSCFIDAETGEMRSDMPSDYKEEPPVWERVESSTNPGTFYYHNTESGETRVERPLGVKILNEEARASRPRPSSAPPGTAAEEEEGIPWQRIESKSKPGLFYYFNPLTGQNEDKPPRVRAPWQLCESTSSKGQWYYFHQVTGLSTETPPRCALPASAAKALAVQPSPTRSTTTRAPMETSPAGRPFAPASGSASDDLGPLPDGWERVPSKTNAGKLYYRNRHTEAVQWQRPSAPPPPPASSGWERHESSTYRGKFFWRNVRTGETKWT